MKNITYAIKALATVLISLNFLACGGTGGGKSVDKIILKATSASVGGDLEGYVEVVNTEINLTPSSEYGKGLETKVKFKILKPFDKMGQGIGIDHFRLDLLDEGAMPTPGLTPLKFDGWCCFAAVNELKGLLKKGSGDFIATFYMETPYELIGKDFKNILGEKETDLKKFSINSLTSEDKKADESESGSGTDNSSTSGSEDYDKMLDDYEEYTDQYIKFLKKANEGDMEALAEYPELMEKATASGLSMQNAQGSGNLSSAQIGRLAKIQAKMMKAAVEMQNKK